MPQKIAIAVIHGIGSQSTDFADGLIDEINDRVSNLGKNADDIAWEPVYWANILSGRQKKYLEDANRGNDLDYIGLRRFIISFLGDASAYRKVNDPNNSTYGKIHDRVGKHIKNLSGKVGKDAPLIVMAHSLGGQIMSNYIWDMQKRGGKKMPQLSNFERFSTLAGMITFGCNIPLFTLAYGKSKIFPITIPREPKIWRNYFDPDDILGYPLKVINKAYDNAVDEDIAISVGGLFSGWNPLSHNKYWTDNDFTKPVAKFVADFF